MEKIDIIRQKKGFIAALDQSGGSSGKTLKLYGIGPDKYKNDLEMFDLIHKMRQRVILSKSFTSDKIIGVILFYETMNRKINGQLTADYLWNEKKIISFLKIDKGLEQEENGVQLMKNIPTLKEDLNLSVQRGVFGTKMRSVINSFNEVGIKNIVRQQFDIAKIISSFGLVPIIEPEVSILCKDKVLCEELLLKEIEKELTCLDSKIKVIFKFTIPSINNFYDGLLKYDNVVRLVALSGGYEQQVACQKLIKNHNMIASFSRALLEGLNVEDNKEVFDQKLAHSIDLIYDASIN